MSSFPIYIKHVQIFWTHWLIFLYNWSDTYFTTKCSCHHGWTNVLFPNILKTWKIVHTYCQLSITFIILITLYNWFFIFFFTFKCSFHHDWIHIMWNQKLTNWSKVSKGNAIFVYYCFFSATVWPALSKKKSIWILVWFLCRVSPMRPLS